MPGLNADKYRPMETTAEAVSRAAERIAHNLPLIASWAKANEKGYPTTSPGFGEGRSKAYADDGSKPGPTPGLAISGRDPVKLIDGIAKRVDRAFQEILALDGLLAKLIPEEPVRGRQSTIAVCVACGGDCLPRPKSGRCEACYKYRERHGHDKPKPKPVPRQGHRRQRKPRH